MTNAKHLGSLAAKVTRKIAQRKPQQNKLYLLQKHWQKIAPNDFAENASPQTVSAIGKTNQQDPPQWMATIAVSSHFAPIAIHESNRLLTAIKSHFGDSFIHLLRFKQIR